MSEPGYAIETKAMSRSFGDRAAVRKLSMHVPQGSVYALVGPRNAGKTTVLRTFATLEPLDAGTAYVAGIDLSGDPHSVRDRVAYMPDSFGRYGPLTIDEYLDFYGAAHGLSPAAWSSLRDDLVELMDLAEARHRWVDSLPPGMQRRLALARCLIHDPDILLLDEPVRGIDAGTRDELREILAELADLGKTILLTSEHLAEVASTCTHVGIIEEGELTHEGPLTASFRVPRAGMRLQVRLLDPAHLETAARVLNEAPVCTGVKVRGERSLTVDFAGDEQDLSNLLSAFGTVGVPVTGFALEDEAPPNTALNGPERAGSDA